MENKRIHTNDDRTGKIAETTIHLPTENVLNKIRGAKTEYNRLVKYFKTHPVRKRK